MDIEEEELLGEILYEKLKKKVKSNLDTDCDDLVPDGFQSRNLYTDLLPNADKIPEVLKLRFSEVFEF